MDEVIIVWCNKGRVCHSLSLNGSIDMLELERKSESISLLRTFVESGSMGLWSISLFNIEP